MKKRAEKKKVFLALGLTLCLLSACVSGGQEAGSFTGPKETREKTLIRIAWWGGPQREKVTQRLLEKYQETHSWIEFEMYSTDMESYLDEISVLAASGRMPDILQMDDSFLADYVNHQALTDLSVFVGTGKIRTADLEENLLEAGYVEDHLLAEYLAMWRDLMDADIAPTPEEQEEMQILFPGEGIIMRPVWELCVPGAITCCVRE